MTLHPDHYDTISDDAVVTMTGELYKRLIERGPNLRGAMERELSSNLAHVMELDPVTQGAELKRVLGRSVSQLRRLIRGSFDGETETMTAIHRALEGE